VTRRSIGFGMKHIHNCEGCSGHEKLFTDLSGFLQRFFFIVDGASITQNRVKAKYVIKKDIIEYLLLL
jgi:hypothetical protein